MLDNWVEPFPGLAPDLIPHNAPAAARDALAHMVRLLEAAQTVIARGDALSGRLADS